MMAVNGFVGCISLKTIKYEGTQEQRNDSERCGGLIEATGIQCYFPSGVTIEFSDGSSIKVQY